MGVTEYPCPKCGQAQKVRAPNGVTIFPTLCAACAEEEKKEQGFDRERQALKDAEQEAEHAARNAEAQHKKAHK